MSVPSPTTPAKPSKPRHLWLYALPGGTLPTAVDCDGRRFERVATFKHDFFAATGLYRGPDAALAVLKVGRTNTLWGLPVTWLGRWLRDHECRLYAELQDLPGVPRLIGRVGPTGFLHAFVPGHPLARREAVSDTFFAELRTLLDAIHSRDIAYVDLNKRQNVLVGDDSRPYLIDFQISLGGVSEPWRRLPPMQWLLARFQRADDYHFLKHKRRLRPDQLTDAERHAVARLSIWIRLHRLIARPLTYVRRWFLARLHDDRAPAVEGSDAK